MATQTNTENLSKTKNMGKFFKNVRAELKKVNWPSQKDIVTYTAVVLVFSGLAAIGIWLADVVFGKVLQFIIK